MFRGFQGICQGWREPEPAFCLWVQRSLQDMWILLADQLFSQRPAAYSRRDNRRIHQMIEYLHQHYSEKFSLSSMAASVSVSRGECSRFFKKMMHMTISDYLLE